MRKNLNNLLEYNWDSKEYIKSDDISCIESLFLSCYIKDFKVETEEDLLFSLLFS